MPSVIGILSTCSNGFALLNKMAVMPIYGEKHLKIFFSRTKKASKLNLGTEHWALSVIQVCSNDDRWSIYDLFTARSHLCLCICMGKLLKIQFLKMY